MSITMTTDPTAASTPAWSAWLAPLALFSALVLAALAGIVVDIPALALGVKITSSHTPPGVTLADTFVQDLAFVGASVFCAHLGSRAVRAWQFGLRRPSVGWRSAVGMIVLLIVAFVVLSAIWAAAFNPGKEKLLEQLGSNEGTALLLLSAGLTCVVAPMCEEFLFRGFIFAALANWSGTAFGRRVWRRSATVPAAILTGLLFGGVHVGSAPAVDLAPLAALGFGLCLLYRASGSLYPCMIAHSLNNSVAFASLENWSFGEGVLLTVSALAGIGAVVLLAKRVGLIVPRRSLVGPGA